MKTPFDRGISGSQEDYLETILELTLRDGAARVRDIAKHLKVAKSSVTVALRALAKSGLVHYEPYQLATLTGAGLALARKISQRHMALRNFMIEVLGVSEPIADFNACRIEHVVEDGVMRRLNCFVGFMSESTVAAKKLPRAFASHCSSEMKAHRCEGCAIARV
jgi:DtxR family Mn-dependent transcriptional regulator